MLRWIELTHDFDDDPQLKQDMLSFLKNCNPPASYVSKCITALEKNNTPTKLSDSQVVGDFLSPAPTPLRASGSQGSSVASSPASPRLTNPQKALDLTATEPRVIAEQLSLVEYSLLKHIRSSEFAKQSWSKSDKETKAPNVLKYINWFNKVSNWFATEIVKPQSAEQRSVIIARCIKIGLVSLLTTFSEKSSSL